MLLLVAASGLLSAQTIGSTGLVSGYLFDEPSHSLRPISGVPGSAYLGRAALAGLEHGLPAPGGHWAVALRGGQTVVARLADGSVSREWMPEGLLASYSVAAWSGDGKTLALYDSAAKSFQRITASENSITVAETAVLSIEGAVKSMALSRDGSRAAITAGPEGSMRLYLVTEGAARSVHESALLGPMAALGNRFYVVDEAASMLLEADSAAVPAWPVSGAMTALFIPADGKLLYAALKGSPRIAVYDLAARGQAGEIATDMPAASLLALSRDTLVLLNSRRQKGDTLFVLDTQSDPAVYFVPAGDE